MQPHDVRKLVEDAIGDDWSVTNHHHIDLRRALVQPRMITVIERTLRNGKLRDHLNELLSHSVATGRNTEDRKQTAIQKTRRVLAQRSSGEGLSEILYPRTARAV